VDLHELHTGAEWYRIPEARRTTLQRLGGRTLGTVTPGNILTLAGAVITITGLVFFWQAHYIVGFVLISIGRLFDILDGMVARKTKTSCPFGEGLDASADKLVILLAAIVLIATQAVPIILMIAIAVLEALTGATVLLGRKIGVRLHPHKIGKYATFGLWVALVLYMVSHGLGQATSWGRGLYLAASICSVIALIAATGAFMTYIRTIVRRNALHQR
jgi:phosphatidylglycerophosphate synthase